MPGAVHLPHDRTYHGDGVVLTVAVADAPVAAELRHLMLAMAGISTVIWLTAAFWGRLLCRRALAPITKMAASARSVRRTATDGPLLEVAPSRDELEDLGRAFNELLADLRLSLERQHRFTGDASHQLRTPLTAMLASVEVALRQVRSPDEYQRVLSVVRRRGDSYGRSSSHCCSSPVPSRIATSPTPRRLTLPGGVGRGSTRGPTTPEPPISPSRSGRGPPPSWRTRRCSVKFSTTGSTTPASTASREARSSGRTRTGRSYTCRTTAPRSQVRSVPIPPEACLRAGSRSWPTRLRSAF